MCFCYFTKQKTWYWGEKMSIAQRNIKKAFLSKITAICVSLNEWHIEMGKVLLFWFLIMESYGNIQQNSKAAYLKLNKKNVELISTRYNTVQTFL